MKKVLAAAVAAIGCIGAWADTWTDASTGIEWTYTVANGVATLGGLDSSATTIPRGTSGAVTLPATLGGNPVVFVGDYAFRGCSNLTSVTVQDGIGNIGSSAFEGCVALTSVTIGKDVTNIWFRPFSGCRSLATIQVSGGNPRYKASGGHLLTKDGKTLVCGVKGSNGSASVPSGVTTIGDYAFEGRGGLASATIPAGVTTIGVRAFADCASLAGVTIGSGVESIGESAFSGCRSLASVVIPAGVAHIGDWAFADCTGLSTLSKVTFSGNMDGVEMNIWRAFVGTPWIDAYVAAIAKPANDNRAGAIALTGRSGIANGTNAGAGSEQDEAICAVWDAAAPAWWGWKTVWWKWTAPASERISFLTRGSGFDTVLGVFTLGSGNAPALVDDCDDSSANLSSQVSFNAVKDTTYYIAVAGHESQMGDIVLRWKGATKVTLSYGQLAADSYAKSMSIKFNLVQQGVTLTNFPALVRLSTETPGFSYADFRKAKGGDLRFADADGNRLPHEIDTWNEDGVSTVWVKVPRLEKDTTISAFYGCTGTPVAVDPKDVWDLDYVGVWHLGERALPLEESSLTSSDFEFASGPSVGYAARGVVGGSVDFGDPQRGRMLQAPDHDALDGFTKCTFEAWTFPTNRPASGDKNAAILSKRAGWGNKASYHLYDTGSGASLVVSSNSTTHTSAASIGSVAANTWTHLAVSFDAGSLKSYKNGASAGTATCAVKKINSGAADLCLGNFNPTDARNFPGRIDEVRISKVARSAAWVKATHDTIANAGSATYTVSGGITPTDLVTLGTREYTTRSFGSQKVRCYRDLVYGTRDDAPGEGAEYAGAEGAYNRHRSGNYYDVYVAESFLNSPEALADMPVFVYLHGGSWSEKYDKDGSNGDFLGRVATNGYVVITMDYQLQNEMSMAGGGFTPRANASFADMLGDIDTLLTYLKAQLPTIGMTNTRVVIGGDSAGAHLSMCYAWDQNGSNRLPGVSLRHDLEISCVTSVVGPSDLSAVFGQQIAMFASLPPEYQAAMASSLAFFSALTGADVAGMLAAGDISGVNAVLAAWSPLGLVDNESCRAILAYGYTGDALTESSTDGVVPISNFNSLTNAFAASGVSYDARLFNMDHGSLSGGSEPSATWIVEKLGALKSSFQDDEPQRILYVNVEGSATTNTLDAALVTEYITNIVKQGAGTLVASAISSYTGDFTLEGGVFNVGVKNGAGKDKFANTVYVGPGASLQFSGAANNIMDGKKLVFEGAAASNAPGGGKFFNTGGWVTIGTNMTFTLRSDTKFSCACWNRLIVKDAVVDMQGHDLSLAAAPGNQIEFSSTTFRNPGNITALGSMAFVQASGHSVFEEPGAGAGEIRLRNSASYNGYGTVSASAWRIVATNSGAKVVSNSNRFPGDSVNAMWNGSIDFGKNGSAAFVNYNGGSGSTKVSNTVFNVKGPLSGSGKLTVGPGWLNLHTSDNNTYSGAVVVRGQTVYGSSAIDYPILPGGGGIGLWNGAACFPNASSITFTNTARLAFMDNMACSVPNVKFIALAGETQSVSGGVHAARSTMAGFVKEGAGALLIDSPVSVTGLADVKGGTLKIAFRSDTSAQTQEAMLEPMPQFAGLRFAPGTTLDLSDNVGMLLGDLEGSPVVTNSGMFGIGGKWTLTTPGGKLDVAGQNAMGGEAAGVLCFLPGATFDLADEAAFRTAIAAAGPDGLLVAEANWILDPSNEQLQGSVALPSPAQSLGAGWSMSIGKGRGDDYAGRGLYLRYSDPSASGYAAWIAGKGITGTAAAADKVTNGIANGVRYAFDIDPATSEIGTPIIQVVRDANGNPSVLSRDLATGRDDVTLGILATPDLTDWSNATLVHMKKFATDGLWRPTASESSGYVFPSQMFFKYTIDIQQ